MQVYVNCENNPVSLNKKQYLLRADRRLNLQVFIDLKDREDDTLTNYMLNIEPCPNPIQGKRWTGIWHIDVLLNSSVPNHFANVSTVFSASTPSQRLYQWDKAITLFQAMDPELHKRIPTISQDYDYVLCGSMDAVHADREKYHTALRPHFSYADFGKDRQPEDYVACYNRARVQWVHPGLSSKGKGNLAQRFFECLGIGPVLVYRSEDLPATGLIEDEDYMAYASPTEAIEKMKKLIDNPALREYIYTNGRTKALMNHTYDHRAVSILNAINDFTGAP